MTGEIGVTLGDVGDHPVESCDQQVDITTC